MKQKLSVKNKLKGLSIRNRLKKLLLISLVFCEIKKIFHLQL